MLLIVPGMTVQTDRRNQARKKPLSLVYVELPPSNGGMMRDLNEHGFALRAMAPLSKLEKLAFSFSLDENVRIEGEAVVQWLQGDGRVAGLEFAGLPGHSRDQIRRWLAAIDNRARLEPTSSSSATSDSSSFDALRGELRDRQAALEQSAIETTQRRDLQEAKLPPVSIGAIPVVEAEPIFPPGFESREPRVPEAEKQTTREKMRAAQAAYREANREKLRAYQKAYDAANREKRLAIRAARRAARKQPR